MRSFRIILAAIGLALFTLHAGRALGATTIAFGYLNNKSNSPNFNYLEIIFPNSFASSIRTFKIEVKKPLQVEDELNKKGFQLKKHYEYSELPEITEAIDADIFIFGNFVPLAGNRIKIELHLFSRESNEVFTFTNTGKMETEIFRLVDRISIIVINFLGEGAVYKSRKIGPGARVALLSNIDGAEYNILCAAFMERGYPVTAFQCSDPVSPLNSARFDVFRFIRTKNCSYDVITDTRGARFHHGPWTGENYKAWSDRLKEMYSRYDLNFPGAKTAALERLHASFRNNIDILLVVGFSEDRKSCWLRAIDVKEKELVWMRTGLSASSLRQLGDMIAEDMQGEIRNPLEKTPSE